MMPFFTPLNSWEAASGSVRWTSPSNIALIKYWGKTGLQQPANASVSFTLDACKTDTRVQFEPQAGGGLEVYLDGQRNEAFEPKIQSFFQKIGADFPWLQDFFLRIDTHNTFPHSSGIASSASGMSAMANARGRSELPASARTTTVRIPFNSAYARVSIANRVFPIPGAPTNTTALPSPFHAASTSPVSRLIRSVRPISATSFGPRNDQSGRRSANRFRNANAGFFNLRQIVLGKFDQVRILSTNFCVAYIL
jgi:hypothetical protein